MNFHNEKTRGHNHQSLFEWCCRTICGMIFGNGILCEYHVTSILFGLPMDSGVRGLCKKKLHGKSWEFYWYPLGCAEVSMKQNRKESPWSSHEIFWPVWIPCEEKVNGRICDFPWDPLGSVKNSLKRKSIENPGTFHARYPLGCTEVSMNRKHLWSPAWDFTWDPLDCVEACRKLILRLLMHGVF